jgi:putative ABC transport system ATP-binding protein
MAGEGIRVEDMVKHFGEGDTRVDVIDGASFSVNKGELVALVAPSGAGKTTLLMMIGCVTDPTSGRIWLGDELVYNDKWLVKDKRSIRGKKIGFIFQKSYLIPFLNIIENIILLPQNSGGEEKVIYAKARELLDYFDIGDKEKAMPSQLSGGQQQRAAIIRALANDPEIILADEPTASLDTERSISAVKMLKQIAKEQNVAVIMVTHDEIVIPYCDRIMEIVDKKVVMKNSTEDLKII